MKKHPEPPLLVSLIPIILLTLRLSESTSAVEFVFNGFDPSNISLYGIASIESRILTLTNHTSFSIGRALHPTKIPTKDPTTSSVLPFSTSFIFSMAPYEDILPGHGIVFLFVPYTGIQSANAAEHMGFLNRTNMGSSSNHVFGIEFDVFKNGEFEDMNDNHVGIDVNSLKSINASSAGYYYSDKDDKKSFKELKLKNGKNYQVWIDYANFSISVTMAVAGMERPSSPLLNHSLDLSQVFEDEMYVGFTAATGALVQGHRILGWSFSNSNFSLSEALVKNGLPSFELPKSSVFRSKAFIAGTTAGGILFLLVLCSVVSLLLIRRKRRREREREEMEEWELEYWPHRISYQEIESATKGFSDENVIGIGGNGKVYKGVLGGEGGEIAVKRISHQNDGGGAREFLAEISSLGRMKHRNLVGLRGWCKKEKGSLILVYDYMENGSLDKRVFECSDESKVLSCEDRIRILRDVALGVLYLHEGWGAKVLHRDIKASNVLLDRDMNGRLGDFGLARMHAHGQVPSTTRVVGTVGYLAPEVMSSGRASTETDVFGFGVLILEVLCGRRPIEEDKPPLVDWVWGLMRQGEVVCALDERLRTRRRREGFNEEKVERVLHLGLLCTHPDPRVRPTMRQVVNVLEGKSGGGVDEAESEDMDVYLLVKMKSREMWSKYPCNGSSLHPTFEQIRETLSTSMSLSWSDAIVEGR